MKRVIPTLFLLGLLVPLACSSAEPAPQARPAPEEAPSTEPPSPEPPVDPIGFRSAGTLREARALATATRLADGRVLVAGGENDDFQMLASAEIYDPATETVTPAAPMPEPRAHHTATLLPSGEVLVTGGGPGSEISIPTGDAVLASTVLYDPKTNTWRPTGAMKGARAGHRAVALADGRVLVAGGGAGVGYPCAAVHRDCMIATAEIYDPASGTFSETASLGQARLAFTLDTLPGGRVVAAAGAAENKGLTSVEIFDPAAGTWTKGPALVGQRLYHASTVLGSDVVVVGGKIANVGPVTTTDLLREDADAWRRGKSVDQPRTGAKMIPLPSGRGLLVGGSNQLTDTVLADARIYDATADSWTPIAPMRRGRYSHVLVPASDGSVLVVGGRDEAGAIAAIERTHGP